MNKLTLAAVIAASAVEPVFAYCSEPSVPFMFDFPDAPASYEKPDPPFCLSAYRFTLEHDCSFWELSNYKDELEAYERKLQDYLYDVQVFLEDTIDLANDAEAFVDCSINEVLDELP